MNSKLEERGKLESLFVVVYQQYQQAIPQRILTPKLDACLC